MFRTISVQRTFLERRRVGYSFRTSIIVAADASTMSQTPRTALHEEEIPMKSKSKCFSILCFLILGSNGMAQDCNVCTKEGIDMPISLAAGVVRTPEFSAKRGYYNIDIAVKWLLPTDELRCKMGFAVSPSDNHCKWASLIDLKWRVLDGNEVVAEGTDSGRNNNFDADSDTLSRNVANFKAAAHHKYVVELTLLKDARALNVTQPRLTVEQPGFSF
jgi:hypothetical protein